MPNRLVKPCEHWTVVFKDGALRCSECGELSSNIEIGKASFPTGQTVRKLVGGDMKKPVFFDHIEVHVKDIPKYCAFLMAIFGGGRYKVLDAKSGISMFKSDDGLYIEIKERAADLEPANSGFCQPCLRMEGAEEFIEKKLKLKISQVLDNPFGRVLFFEDHEGIIWHVKDYLKRDDSVNW